MTRIPKLLFLFGVLSVTQLPSTVYSNEIPSNAMCKENGERFYSPGAQGCNRNDKKTNDGCCKECNTCPIGYGQKRQFFPDPCDIVCEPCKKGETFSNKIGVAYCLPCKTCELSHRITATECTATANSQCGKCKDGYYETRDIITHVADIICAECWTSDDHPSCKEFFDKTSSPPPMTAPTTPLVSSTPTTTMVSSTPTTPLVSSTPTTLIVFTTTKIVGPNVRNVTITQKPEKHASLISNTKGDSNSENITSPSVNSDNGLSIGTIIAAVTVVTVAIIAAVVAGCKYCRNSENQQTSHETDSSDDKGNNLHITRVFSDVHNSLLENQALFTENEERMPPKQKSTSAGARYVQVPNSPEQGGSTKLEVNELQQMSEKVSGTGLNSGNNSPLPESHKPSPHSPHRCEECENMKTSTCTFHQVSQSLQMKTTIDPKGGKYAEGEDKPNGSSNSIPGHAKVSPTSSGYLSDADPKTLDNSSQGSSGEEEWEDAHNYSKDQNLPAGNDQIQTGRVVTEAETKPRSKAKAPREQVSIIIYFILWPL
ncbi:uncharacterized protein C1235.01 [Lingula anatina]|uniref:Uncharacterized protein C1235.01 n=1 Tax=Lingula anatina TaxID=7574 RepID=A0A2R2MJK3_LINAN|nr:uncharacterized protein C1235.01 [Lingula anatina]|eukprot:XP_023930378.1 uncharacterized protein C1235.01 [Lingula anatina]